MARITPDGYTKIHFVPTVASTAAMTVAELGAGVELTSFLTPAGLDTPEDGTDADSSSIASPRDFSIPATVGGDISGEFYRDDTADTAWTTLARLTEGYLIVGRFGGSVALTYALQATDTAELWTVRVSQRSNSRITRGEALRFTSTFAVSADMVTTTVTA